MLSNWKVILLSCSFVFSFTANTIAQSVANPTAGNGGEYPMRKNNASNPCITPEQYRDLEKRISENTRLPKGDNTPAKRTTSSTLFTWPLATAAGFSDCGYYLISNYVDQDPTSGIRDYNCGAVSYDGHKGTDIAIGPYPFYKMDNNQVTVVAAAAGTIIDKQDGFFDRNCAMGSAQANYIIIQHADGSCALYWHMKKFSLTTKIVGQTVIAGEFLGVVASSGSSTGPHLHFEVWNGTTSATLNDPYSGSCNILNPSTWWVSQKAYTEPAVLKMQVNNIAPVLPGCDTTETSNEDSCFASAAAARFYFYIRDETAGMTANLRIINPSGTTFTSWIHNSTLSYKLSYWYWTKTLPTAPGIYTFETVYNGITCTKKFKVNCGALSTPTLEGPGQIEVYPNPVNSSLNITMDGVEDEHYQLTLTNTIGQTLLTDNVTAVNNACQKSVSMSTLPSGIYFLTIQSGKTRITKKIVKE